MGDMNEGASLLTFLQLDRRLVIFDLETHDFVPMDQAYICEIGMMIIEPDGKIKSWGSLIQPHDGRRNVPIAKVATEKHNITNEMVAGKPTFGQLAVNLHAGMSKADFGGYNVRRFDLPMLEIEFKRNGITFEWEEARILDGLRLWQVAEPRTLTDAVERFLRRKTTEAHRADGDARDAHDVIAAQLAEFSQLPRTIQELHDLCFFDPENVDLDGKFKWRGDEAVIAFGKYQGTALARVATLDPGYLRWMLGGTFATSTKRVAQDALEGRFPVKKPLAPGPDLS